MMMVAVVKLSMNKRCSNSARISKVKYFSYSLKAKDIWPIQKTFNAEEL